MPDTTIRLDPDLFMALGLSVEAHGGVGRGASFHNQTEPLCIYGHAKWLDGGSYWEAPTSMEARLPLDGAFGGLIMDRNDSALQRAGVTAYRIPFTRWLRIVGVDVRDA